METLWLILIGGGLLTYLTRVSFFWLFTHWQPPDLLQRALRYVPGAVLSAIIFPEILFRDGSLFFSLANFRLIAGVVAALVAWKSRNIMWTILSGMAALLLLQWLFA